MIGLVIPVYNEETRLNFGYFEEVSDLTGIFLLFVNDGSTDKSEKLIKRFAASINNCAYISLRQNLGKAEALRYGFHELSSRPNIKYLGFLDSDAAFSVDDINRISTLINSGHYKTKASNIWWWSSRKKNLNNQINRRLTRHLIGRLLSKIIQIGFDSLPYDTQSGFKLFQATPAFISILEFPMKTKWFIDVELLIRFKNISGTTLEIKEFELSKWDDISGSKISFKSVFLILREVAMVKYIQFSSK
jgi:glycosyltransferase involved in cell wall biosynthesis